MALLPATSLRSHWLLDEAVTFLNHGSFGACPREVLAYQSELRHTIEREPVNFFVRELEPLLDALRVRLAQLLSAKPTDLALVPNATAGCNAVLASFPLTEGDEVLVTSHGYNAVNNAAARWAEPRGASVRFAPLPFPVASESAIVASLEAAFSARTRLLVIDHVTSPSALVLPVKQLVDVAHKHGCEVLVDGAHAPGMFALDVPSLGAGFYTGNLHKWVCAPKGAAFLWVREDLQARLQPIVTSHGRNAQRTDRSRFQLEFDWTGTDDPTAHLSVAKALDFLEGISEGSLATHYAINHGLLLQARELLCRRLGIEAPAPSELLGTMVTLPLPDRPEHEADIPGLPGYADPLQKRLVDEHRIQVPIINWPTPRSRFFRVSAQRYNQLADYERLADALESLLGRS